MGQRGGTDFLSGPCKEGWNSPPQMWRGEGGKGPGIGGEKGPQTGIGDMEGWGVRGGKKTQGKTRTSIKGRGQGLELDGDSEGTGYGVGQKKKLQVEETVLGTCEKIKKKRATIYREKVLDAVRSGEALEIETPKGKGEENVEGTRGGRTRQKEAAPVEEITRGPGFQVGKEEWKKGKDPKREHDSPEEKEGGLTGCKRTHGGR